MSADVTFSLNGTPMLTAIMNNDLVWIDLRTDAYPAAVISVQTLTAQQCHDTGMSF